MAGALFHSMVYQEMNGRGSNFLGALLNDIFPRLGSHPRNLTHDYSGIARASLLLSLDGYSWVGEGMANHGACDESVHRNLYPLQNAAREWISYSGMHPMNKPYDVSDGFWESELEPHRFGELAPCRRVYSEDSELPFRITELREGTDLRELSESLVPIFWAMGFPEGIARYEDEVDRVHSIMVENFGMYPRHGQGIVDFLEENREGLDYVLGETGLDTESGWRDYKDTVIRETGRLLREAVRHGPSQGRGLR